MKKLTYAALLLAIGSGVMISSCKKPKVDVDFNMDVANIYFAIDSTSQTGQMNFAATTFKSDLQKKLDENNASMDDIQSIAINNATFTMINPNGQNFDIVEKANAYLSAGGLTETRIAYNEAIPNGLTSVDLKTASGDLKEYLKQSVVNFRADGFTSGPNVERDSIQVKLTFKILVSVEAL